MAALNLGAKKRATFNELRVAEVRPLTDTSVEVTFEVPDDLPLGWHTAPVVWA